MAPLAWFFFSSFAVQEFFFCNCPTLHQKSNGPSLMMLFWAKTKSHCVWNYFIQSNFLLIKVSVYPKWPSFVGTALWLDVWRIYLHMLKYIFSESLWIVDYEGTFIKICSVVPYFLKYRGLLIKFVSDLIWVGGRNEHRYVFLTPPLKSS